MRGLTSLVVKNMETVILRKGKTLREEVKTQRGGGPKIDCQKYRFQEYTIESWEGKTQREGVKTQREGGRNSAG